MNTSFFSHLPGPRAVNLFTQARNFSPRAPVSAFHENGAVAAHVLPAEHQAVAVRGEDRKLALAAAFDAELQAGLVEQERRIFPDAHDAGARRAVDAGFDCGGRCRGSVLRSG